MADPGRIDADPLPGLGERLFAGECVFLRAVTELADLPETTAPEIAFAGRSNVGKSSLINALTGRRKLARTSHTPGRTRELHFYRVSPPARLSPQAAGLRLPDAFLLVDMPGYGYARAPKKLVKSWNALISAYLKGRPQLARVYVLIDARRGLGPQDLALLELLDEAAVSHQIVCTKIDQLTGPARALLSERLARALSRQSACHPRLHLTSARTGEGVARLKTAIAALLAGVDDPAPDTGGDVPPASHR